MATVPSVPVSWGELLDKISILDIKRERLSPGPSHDNVVREHDLLSRSASEVMELPSVAALYARLRRVNATLWDVEDAIREQEAQALFGPPFVALARSVYQTNDTRAAVKREINLLLECDLIEEKSYADTRSPSAQPLAALIATAGSAPPAAHRRDGSTVSLSSPDRNPA